MTIVTFNRNVTQKDCIIKHGSQVEQRAADNQLKGDNVWPGMGLFDSATVEMRRTRNQRKDDSVFERMMANSAEIQPVVCVYDSEGSLLSTRDLFGPLSTENSPVRKRKVFSSSQIIGSLLYKLLRCSLCLGNEVTAGVL